MPSRTFAIVVSRVYLPPGWAKLWWFADDIQYDHQHKLQKKAPRFFSGRIHAPADSFISKNEGMNEPSNTISRRQLRSDHHPRQISSELPRSQHLRGGSGCLNRIPALISGASADVKL